MNMNNIDLATHPRILDELENDLKKLGFAGPTDIVKLLYLALQTRRFAKICSAVIKAPSGRGKSFALNQALKFVPPSAYEYFSGMSEKAIVYSGLDLSHRFLVIGEAAGMSQGDGRAFLRQLLSEDQVKYMTVQKTEHGMKGEQLPTVKGPTGLIMTTTSNELHPEDESRMLSISLPDSHEQIRMALLAMAEGHSIKQEVDFSRWHTHDAFLDEGTREVFIPFAREIAERVPLTHYRVQRDFPKLLSLISSHALLHKCIRPTTDDGMTLATLDDYAVVLELVQRPFSEGLETSVPDNIRMLVKATSELLASTVNTYPHFMEGISQQALAKQIGRDQSVVSRSLEAALAQGYLKNLNPGQGRQASIVLGDREIPSGFALPSPEELKVT